MSYSEFFWSVLGPDAGKYGPDKTPNTGTFHAVNSCTIMYRRLHVTELLVAIISLFFHGIFFSFLKFHFNMLYFLGTWNLLKYLWIVLEIIIISGDIDINPGPKSNSLNNIFRFATEIRSA